MPKEYSRTQRLGEQIRRELAELVRDAIKDPRVGMVSFTAIKLSRDLSHATIYCTVMKPEEREEILDALNHAAGFLRRELASSIRARKLPALKFIYDESIDRAAYLSELISRARHEDDERSAHAEPDDSENQ